MLAIDDLLVARDFSPVSDRALRQSLELAAHTEATLHVLFAEVLHRDVSEPRDHPSPAEGLDQVQRELTAERDVPTEAIEDVPIQEVTRRDVAPAPAILNYGSKVDVDLIALGTHAKKMMKRVLLEGVAEEVIRRAERPVFTVRGEEGEDRFPKVEEIRRILVPLDFSEHSREALVHAREWASLYGAKIDVLHVLKDEPHPLLEMVGVKSVRELEPDVDEKALRKMDSFVENTRGPAVEIEKHVTSGRVVPCITEFVDENDVNLVVHSSHGRTGVERFFLGSVAEKTIRHVECPILTVKAFAKAIVASDGRNGHDVDGNRST